LKNSTKNILVAPLNWGLGHSTRCIPIINALIAEGFNPILASDGMALEMLSKEFPNLKILKLPSYQIKYAENGNHFKWKMLKNIPKMFEAIKNEKKIVRDWVKEFDLTGIISDNRLGVFSEKIPSVFITHQLNVLSGNTTWLTSKIHQFIIKKFNECWVTDSDRNPNLSGKLGHLSKNNLNVKYIGPLSRFTFKEDKIIYDLMVLLSGPEPQRAILENQLKNEILKFKGKVVFINGVIEKEQKVEQIENITFYNFMNSTELETTFNQSEKILCRSGYTTIMDLAKLGKKAFFIPTPGQYEQEYLAKKLKREGIVPYVKQDKFKIENLLQIDLYAGLKTVESNVDWKQLFSLFERE
jgi:uncharacterized protein (TIGR00661 family)